MSLRSEPLSLQHVNIIFSEIKGNVAEYFYHFSNIKETELWVEKAVKEHKEGGKEEFIYFDEDTFVGMVSPAFVEQNSATIGMWVATSKQGKGYGKAILLDVLERLKQRGIVKVVYETEAKNTASLQLAKALGFEEVESGESCVFIKKL